MKINRTSYRTIEILRYISNSLTPVTLEMVCAHFKMPKTSAYDILSTLVSTSMVVNKQGIRNTYTIGLSAYQIGMAYKNNLTFASAFEEILQKLAYELNKTVFFAVHSDCRVVYILKYEPEKPIITTGLIGGTNPMYCTALGKSMLAHMPQQEVDEIIASTEMIPHTPYTITTREDLLSELKKIRIQGYSMDFRELENHGVCVGSPIFDANNKLIGAISASGLYNKDEDYDLVGKRLNDIAFSLSKIMGCTK